MSVEEQKEQKPVIMPLQKSSMEILSELFSSFDAEPPIIVKKEKDLEQKKHKKKKKHKHKEKKHKKKSKKRKRSHSNSSESSGVDLTDILIKQEKEPIEERFKSQLMQKTVNKIINDENNVEKDVPIIKETVNDTDTNDQSQKKDKIIIKDLKFSSIFDATIETIKEKVKIKEASDGELSPFETIRHSKETKTTKRHKRKHHHSNRDNSKKRKHRSRSPSREHKKKARSRSHSKTPDKSGNHKSAKHKHKDNDDKQKDHKCKHDNSRKHRHTDYRSRNRDSLRDKDEYEDHKWKKQAKESFYKRDSSSEKEEKWFMRDRYRGYSDRDRVREKRFREKSEENSTHIDKKKLLEIARKNAIQMMKSGSLPGALTLGPQAQEKVIAAIKSGGKTVEELTDFCKTLSKKEELGELSSISDDNGSESDNEKPFHHPFQIKERPVSITMNIKNSVPLPIKNLQERASELRIQFPVSSGQQHRKTENEWVPVPPKKPEQPAVPVVKPTTAVVPIPAPSLAEIALPPPIEPEPPIPAPVVTAPQPGAQVFSTPLSTDQNIDIAAIVTQRLSAMRKLQENPNDVQALNSMYKAQKEMNTWAESKQQIGQFTGSTGAQILSQAELASGYQAWARKDQLQTAAPVSGGMGMHLLQKMGWKPGEGLGKEKTGALEPLLLEVKLDKKGIVAKEEQKKKPPKIAKANAMKTLQGKHPVSLLGEYATKNKLGVPQYDLCFECGPDHKKNFLFRVLLNDIEYKPQVASPNKKEAKANAALVCLQALGILLPPLPVPLQTTD